MIVSSIVSSIDELFLDFAQQGNLAVAIEVLGNILIAQIIMSTLKLRQRLFLHVIAIGIHELRSRVPSRYHTRLLLDIDQLAFFHAVNYAPMARGRRKMIH